MRLLLLFSVSLSLFARAQPVVGAGDAARDSATSPAEPTPHQTTVTDTRPPDDSTLVGPYHQPKWTERRRFPETRVYVAPAGAATAEFWFEPKLSMNGDPVRLRTMYELSFGLGYRLQLDLYLRLQHDGVDPMRVESERVELRYALADWGVLWGNPTLYLEWIRPTAEPQRLELKLLLGGDITDRLFWGANLFWERELWGGPQESEYGATFGLSYAVDRAFGLGVEARAEFVDHRTTRFNPDGIELLVGPSISWRPIDKAHVLLVAFVGPELSRAEGATTHATVGVFQPNLVFGWRF
jgi:hypothetical protein